MVCKLNHIQARWQRRSRWSAESVFQVRGTRGFNEDWTSVSIDAPHSHALTSVVRNPDLVVIVLYVEVKIGAVEVVCVWNIDDLTDAAYFGVITSLALKIHVLVVNRKCSACRIGHNENGLGIRRNTCGVDGSVFRNASIRER